MFETGRRPVTAPDNRPRLNRYYKPDEPDISENCLIHTCVENNMNATVMQFLHLV